MATLAGLLALALIHAGQVGVNAANPKLEIRPGDHISIIGNTLADRMQHDGWLESYLHACFPTHNLSIRNLGFSGDELTIRLRSAAFGSPDEWLTRTKTDVVFAFFGYNESFAGKDGLEIYRRLVPQAFAALTPGGFIALEIGYGQQPAIQSLLAGTGFTNIEFTPDLQGIPRVAIGQRP